MHAELLYARQLDYISVESAPGKTVVTNQPDVARGTTPLAVVEEINEYLAECLPIDEFRTCYHDSGDDCDCRKPLPGSLVAAAQQHGIDLGNSYVSVRPTRMLKVFYMQYAVPENSAAIDL